MDKLLIRIIKLLLDEIEDSADLVDRVEVLEQHKEQVEAVWPQIAGDDNGSD